MKQDVAHTPEWYRTVSSERRSNGERYAKNQHHSFLSFFKKAKTRSNPRERHTSEKMLIEILYQLPHAVLGKCKVLGKRIALARTREMSA